MMAANAYAASTFAIVVPPRRVRNVKAWRRAESENEHGVQPEVGRDSARRT